MHKQIKQDHRGMLLRSWLDYSASLKENQIICVAPLQANTVGPPKVRMQMMPGKSGAANSYRILGLLDASGPTGSTHEKVCAALGQVGVEEEAPAAHTAVRPASAGRSSPVRLSGEDAIAVRAPRRRRLISCCCHSTGSAPVASITA